MCSTSSRRTSRYGSRRPLGAFCRCESEFLRANGAFSGPKRYDYVESLDGWYYSRDKRSIESLLDEELSMVFGREVKLGAEAISKKVEE